MSAPASCLPLLIVFFCFSPSRGAFVRFLRFIFKIVSTLFSRFAFCYCFVNSTTFFLSLPPHILKFSIFFQSIKKSFGNKRLFVIRWYHEQSRFSLGLKNACLLLLSLHFSKYAKRMGIAISYGCVKNNLIKVNVTRHDGSMAKRNCKSLNRAFSKLDLISSYGNRPESRRPGNTLLKSLTLKSIQEHNLMSRRLSGFTFPKAST